MSGPAPFNHVLLVAEPSRHSRIYGQAWGASMDRGLALIIGFTFYKIACVACGAFVCWLGYRLFVGGLWNSAGDVEGKFGEASIVFRSAAPGTFFTVLGMVLSIMAVWRGYDFST